MATTAATTRGILTGLGLAAAVFASSVVETPPNPYYTGTLPIREWTPEETGGEVQSFSILQHPDTGLIYAGNEAGVLEYDGARWRRLPLPAGAPGNSVVVRGLAWDDRGRLWGGVDNDVFVYSADDRGDWRAEALRERLPAHESGLGIVWELRFAGGFVWAATTQGVLRIDPHGAALKRWPMEGKVADAGEVDGEAWFWRNGRVLLRARGGEIEPAPVPPLPAGVLALGVARTPAGMLQVDHTNGVLELLDGAWVPLGSELGVALEGAASRVVRLPDGRRVFSTRTRTLVVADASGRVLGRIGEPAGVNFGVTPRTMIDRDGGLWMANASGIRRLQLDGVVSHHGRAQGLRGYVRNFAFEGERLLVGTSQGLFMRQAGSGVFTAQPGMPVDAQRLWPSPAGGWLLAAGARFAEWRDVAAVNTPGAPTNGTSVVTDPREPSTVLVARVNEVGVYRRLPDRWIEEGAFQGIEGTAYFLECDDAGVLWISKGLEPGLWRAVASPGGWTSAAVRRIDHLPDTPWQLARIDRGVVIYGAGGAWRERPDGTLGPDDNFAGLPRGAATPLSTVKAGENPDTLFVAGAGEFLDRYWRGTRAEAGAPWRFEELPLAELKLRIRDVALAGAPDGGTLWIGAADGAYSADLTAAPPKFIAPVAMWRGVREDEGGRTVYRGVRPVESVALPPGHRAVTVEFAAASFRVQANGRPGIEYRTRVDGVDRDWTAWSAATTRELTNLPPGNVKFEVQARSHLGAEGPVAPMVLVVPRYWWETWWARLATVLVGAGIVALIVRRLVRRQFRQRIALLEAQAAVQQERLRIARDMHDDLGSTLASIVHLSDGTAPPEQAGPALARVHAAARDLVQRTRDIVWAATPQHDSLESLVEQMAAHAERTLGDRGIAVKVDLPAQVPEEAVPSGARHDVFLAFKEAVNNAAKYSAAKTATVRVALEPETLLVVLTDDGVGFAAGEARGSGHGLPNLRARLATLGGSADITSAPGRGTAVTLRVPRSVGRT